MTVNTECTLGYIICQECKRFSGGPAQCITQPAIRMYFHPHSELSGGLSVKICTSPKTTRSLEVVFAFVGKLLMRTIGNGNRCAKINGVVSVPQGCKARSASAVFLVVSQTHKKQRQVCVKQHREYRYIYIESIFFF